MKKTAFSQGHRYTKVKRNTGEEQKGRENRQREEVESLRHDTGGYNYVMKQEITEPQPKP